MAKEKKKSSKNSKGNKNLMFSYAFIQLILRIFSTLSIIFIAFNLSSVGKHLNLIETCVKTLSDSGQTSVEATHYCNGGNKSK
tara:strand:+ start:512 stop:760 length:249 start_codon:yes stop_codon:yes gene_type:complete